MLTLLAGAALVVAVAIIATGESDIGNAALPRDDVEKSRCQRALWHNPVASPRVWGVTTCAGGHEQAVTRPQSLDELL